MESNDLLQDDRLDSILDIIADLRKQMIREEDFEIQQKLWLVIKNYQNRIRAGEFFIPKF